MTSTSMTTAAEPDGAPRVASLDILRGIAILGILFMNINAMGGAMESGWEDLWRYGHSRADEVAYFLRMTLADGTARCLLEMLFGAGMVILTDRAAAAAEASGRSGRLWRIGHRLFGPLAVLRAYYWRNFVLFLFGVAHIFILLWAGDILHTYGFAAMIAVLFRKLGPKMLLALGLTMALLQLGGGAYSYVDRTAELQQVAAIEAKQKAGTALTAPERKMLADVKDRKVKRDKREADANARMAKEDVARSAETGTFLSWAGAAWSITGFIQAKGLEILFVWEAAATMLVGAALFRWGVLQGARSSRFYIITLILAYGFGLSTRGIGAVEEIIGHVGPSITWATMEVARLATTLGHVALVHLLLRTVAGTRALKPFEAAGRTALSVYIAQTMVCLWVLYPPFMLGLYGQQGWAAWMLTALAVNAALLWGANVWVRHYSIAPVEWAWRSIVAWRRLPFRRRDVPSVGPAVPAAA
ncbi:uncharacterized protein SAMN06297144_2844 [Sphingomonas guangdongensis]|uniref:DUF418 domain-containing protein n=1 Tax=Sphingomonas guangdongensis TaxID=1141890 RepID=A0A285R1R7_9SPHN|nr:DUF418 domain-containing protein [Sphingomonas guangdongensis]SOB87708.1 uncharacterized protein SAMN06297144_2844 [Sphingomonas guangdongensis]